MNLIKDYEIVVTQDSISDRLQLISFSSSQIKLVVKKRSDIQTLIRKSLDTLSNSSFTSISALKSHFDTFSRKSVVIILSNSTAFVRKSADSSSISTTSSVAKSTQKSDRFSSALVSRRSSRFQ